MSSFSSRNPGFYKRLWTLSLPVILQNLITFSLGLIDTFMVSQLGNKEMAAVTAANVPVFLLFSIVFGVQSGLGDRTCKNELEMCLQELIAPMRERRATYIQDKGMLMAMLKKGSEEAHKVTQQTLKEVKQGLGLPVF